MTHQAKKIALEKIYLDAENPRHGPIENEKDIIDYLIKNENIKDLAKSIAEQGISPIEKIAVIPHPAEKDAFIAAEGNRRTCALKLLSEPEKASDQADRDYFLELSSKTDHRPKIIDVIIFDSAESAKNWVSLRHEGAQGGVGTKPWTPQQKARFNAKSNTTKKNPDIQASLLLDYAIEQDIITEDNAKKLSLTTITRYLGNPNFRNMLGLTSRHGLRINVTQNEFNKVLKKFISDLADPNGEVSSRTNSKDRINYADKLRANGDAPTARGLDEIDLAFKETESIQSNDQSIIDEAHSISESQPAKENESKLPPKKRNNKNPDSRQHIIPRSFSVKIQDSTMKRLFDELRAINPENFSFAATYLLRALIEQAATKYLKQEGKLPKGGELHSKLSALAELLESDGADNRTLKNIRVMASDRDSRYSPDTIGHFVHGGAIPTRTDIIKIWDSIETVFSEVCSRLK